MLKNDGLTIRMLNHGKIYLHVYFCWSECKNNVSTFLNHMMNGVFNLLTGFNDEKRIEMSLMMKNLTKTLAALLI